MKAVVLFAAATSMLAQNAPPLSNAHLEIRAFSANDLASELRSATPSWFGYQIQTVRRDESCCWSDSSRGCWLEGHFGKMVGVRSDQPVQLEGSDKAAVLYRVDKSGIEKIEMFSMSCPLDGGGLPFVWLTGVSSQASLTELRQLAVSEASKRLSDSAIFAVAQHPDTEADTILNQLAVPNEPERVREKVAFWLGASRGASGVKTLQEMLKNDPSASVRDKAVFALSISKQPEGTETLIAVARTDPSPHVRSQAIFWLAQKAGKQAETIIVNAIQNDPDTEVKKKAVFALSQLPKDNGIPKLIDVARTQRNPEVRKQAFFWLGQSGDPRALQYIEQVLEK
ncbi:MAG TPA: HEAT repeat domain-containing protein [Bryobacteraceae bacterium]|nr:HEAT repeat domain-containing protein [Bryobacteraceae bacterium]